MQILQGAGALAGARGWLWRVERLERAGRQATLASLARADDEGTRTLTAVRPAEPMSRVGASGALHTVGRAAAIDAVRRARALERPAFGIAAAVRLAGEIHSWQLAAALVFARGHPRVLLADPVGMGKTVSAALAIAECLREGPDRRSLVIAPGHLLAQWRAELRGRIAIDADVADAASVRRLERGLPAGMAAWARPGCLIASIDFIKQPHVARAIETVLWDLLVIDEAHLACGESERHAACEMIARRARRLLLLTATPSDGGSPRLAALTRLGSGGERLVVLRHAPLSAPTARTRSIALRPDVSVARLHAALRAYVAWLAAAPRGNDPAIGLLASLLVKRALSSAHAVHLSLERRAALVAPDEASGRQPSLFDDEEDPEVLGTPSGRPRDEERHRLDMLIGLSSRAARDDRRLDALGRLLARAKEPAVIFTCFRDTAVLLARRLSPGLDIRLVHGTLPAAVTDAALSAFTHGTARALVATDVAASGLNLHHRCRWVIHYDQPWRPSTMRQRNGRVDRLGQRRAPHVTTLWDDTPLARAFVARGATLEARMRDDDPETPRRWRVIAGAEASRVRAARGEAAPMRPDTPQWPVSIVEICLGGAGGVLLERRTHGVAAGAAVATAWAAREAARRAAAIGRALDARAARRIARERTVHAAACERLASTRVQRGLFDHRAAREAAAKRSARAHLGEERDAAIARHLDTRRVCEARVDTIAVFTSLAGS